MSISKTQAGNTALSGVLSSSQESPTYPEEDFHSNSHFSDLLVPVLLLTPKSRHLSS